nr:MAG TPA: uracil transporter [Caudoviricetes sp.]
MIYNLDDRMPLKHIFLYGVQELLAILVATLLIASICGVSVGAGLIGAGLSTLLYIVITKGNSNVYISNSGAFVAPVLFAFGTGGATAAIVGGITICIIYIAFGFIFGRLNIETMYKFLPKPLIGAVTILIGLSLIGYVPTYLGESGGWGLVIALITAFIIALVMHYGKGKAKTLPFLIAVGVGYILSVILTITGVAPLVDFSVFKDVHLFQIPAFNFMALNSIDLTTFFSVVIMYMAYSISAICEVIADHQAMSVVIGDDLFERNGIKRIFIAMGCANALSGIVSGLGQTTYGEGTGCAAASKVANARVTAMTSILLVLMGFCGYIQALMVSIPSCVFAGASLILYPLISIAGFNMLINNQVDLSNAKNMLMVGLPISIGLGGIIIGGANFSLSSTALALIVGIILNLILKE